MKTQSRRTVLGQIVAGGVAATMTATATAAGADPIFAMIVMHKKLTADWQGLYDQLQEAEFNAAKEDGHRPIELIHRRDYTIGASEIDTRRQTLLEAGEIDPATVEQEYLDGFAGHLESRCLHEEWRWARNRGPHVRTSQQQDGGATEIAGPRARMERASWLPLYLLPLGRPRLHSSRAVGERTAIAAMETSPP